MSERLPFDPGRIRPPAETGGGVAGLPLSPRQVNELIAGAVHRHLPATLHVVGEVGDLSRPSSGHLYFTLKDAFSELRCVMWRSAATKVRFELRPGQELVASGALEVYTPRGVYQLVVRRLEPHGIGARDLALRQLREKLEAEGMLDPRRKRALPRFPRRVALITSPSGAALRDILRTLQRRFPCLDLLLLPVRVQGDGAAAEIAAALSRLGRVADALGPIDLAIVGRGGGSQEDLWAFNEEIVARAILASPVPVISAVGHEVDVTIADLVADVRAATPTAAAELATPDRRELEARLTAAGRTAARRMAQRAELARSRLERAARSEWLMRPLRRFEQLRQRLDELEPRIARLSAQRRREARLRLNRSETGVLRALAGLAPRLGRELERRVVRAVQAVGRRVRTEDGALRLAASRVDRADPRRRLAALAEHLRQAVPRLRAAVGRCMERGRALLALRLATVEQCDPRRVLARGYSVTRDARDGRIVRSVREIRAGTRLLTQFADGEVRSTADDPRQPRLFE